MSYYDDVILQTRNKKSFNKDILRAVKVLSIDPDMSQVFGSANYKMQPYPGDVDTSEVVEFNGNMNDAINYLEIELKKIVKNIFDIDGYYITEIKAGLDNDFDILDVGKLVKGKIIGYDPLTIIKALKSLYDYKLLTLKELDEFLSFVVPNIKKEHFEELYNMARNKLILRWSAAEFLRGYKIMYPNRRISLNEALHSKTMVKIDMLAPINNKYIEVTNFYILQYIDKNGKVRFVNLDDNHFKNVIPSLAVEIDKLYYNSIFYNPLKMAKRMWSMSRIRKDMPSIEKLTPLLRSDAGLLAQMNSELETVIMIFERVNTLPYSILFSQLNDMKGRLEGIIQIKLDTIKLFDLIDSVTSGDLSREQSIKSLKEFKKYIKDKMIKFAEVYLKKVKMLPPPSKFLDP